jgi:hypothetical protein
MFKNLFYRSPFGSRSGRKLGLSTGFTRLDQLLRHLRKQRADMFRVLDRPEIQLHTNGLENEIVTGAVRRETGRE